MRHPFADHAIAVIGEAEIDLLTSAEDHETNEKWQHAWADYKKLGDRLFGRSSVERAKALARSAYCAEILGQHRDSAHAYQEAGFTLKASNVELQVAGELYNRAGYHYRLTGEFEFAGSAYDGAAKAFESMPGDRIQTTDNILPVPLAGFKFGVAAECLLVAGECYSKVKSYAGHDRANYWRAGNLYKRLPMPNIQTCMAYLRALEACVSIDRTLEREHLRKALPLTDGERNDKVDPIEILEMAYFNILGHQFQNQALDANDRCGLTQLLVDREMRRVFRAFRVGLENVGNSDEASEFYVAEKERELRLLKEEDRWWAHKLMWLWKVSCSYGESLLPWSLICGLIILFFSIIYGITGLIVSNTSENGIPTVLNSFDYLFFSFVTFTCFGYSDVRPVGGLAQLLISAEVLLGLLMLGMFITYLGRRLTRE